MTGPEFMARFKQKFPHAGLTSITMNTFDDRNNPVSPYLVFTVNGVRFRETTPNLPETLDQSDNLEDFLVAVKPFQE